jgi:cytochrome b561
MFIANTRQQFGLVAKLIHWLMALLFLGLIWLGWYMVRLGYYDPWSQDSLIVHKSLGLVVLALALFKLLWLLISPTPEPLPTLNQWQHKSSKLVHWILFLCMFVIPITGYVISTSEGAAIPIFNWFDVPALFVADNSARDVAIDTHYYVAYAILAVVGVHAGAAFKHQFIDRDGTLKRML